MDSKQLEREIKDAQSGSDIHGLVEKMAYRLHKKNSLNSADGNWFMAQDIFLKWSDYQYGKETAQFSLSDRVHALLNHYAYDNHQCRYFWGDQTSQFDDWMHAQDELAKQVLHQVTII